MSSPYHRLSVLEVPELLQRIGEFLQRQDLATCLRVSTLFHANLAPLLYRSLDLDTGTTLTLFSRSHCKCSSTDKCRIGFQEKKCQGLQRVRQHRQKPVPRVLKERYGGLVRRVKLETSLLHEYLAVGFTHLTAVTLFYNGESSTKTALEAAMASRDYNHDINGIENRRKKMRNPEGQEINTTEEREHDCQLQSDNQCNKRKADDNGDDTTADGSEALVRLVRTNKNLVSWTFEKFRTHSLPADVWKAIVESAHERICSSSMLESECKASTISKTGLELLEVKQMKIDHDSAPWFARACRLAKILKLVVVDLSHANLLYSYDIPSLMPLPSPLPLRSSPLSQQEQRQKQKQKQKQKKAEKDNDALWAMPPVAQEINLWSLQGITFMDQLRFLIECSQARFIAWSSPCAQWQSDLFHLSLHDIESLFHPDKPSSQDQESFYPHKQHVQSPKQPIVIWPYLHSLRFSEWLRGKIDPMEMSALGHSISLLLQHTHQLQSFRLSGAKIHATTAVPSLQRHHAQTLQHVRLRGCPSATSEMVQGLLESCPNLLSITANVLTAETIIRGKPWVCQNLIEFQVYLDFAFSSTLSSSSLSPQLIETWDHFEKSLQDAHNIVYARLSTLCALERLLIAPFPSRFSPITISRSGPTGILVPSSRQGLHLDLLHGLDRLSTLQSLKVLNFVDVEQNMDVKTLEWMVSNWDHLSHVQGIIAPSLEQSSILSTILTNHGVSYSYG
ncbi:hypothetical protein FBU30_001879 [Linnemannia zychae]|nr:hypothetical protein FBU30_001879 [Linnemannia zychae]